jgi:hypothetical protein
MGMEIGTLVADTLTRVGDNGVVTEGFPLEQIQESSSVKVWSLTMATSQATL